MNKIWAISIVLLTASITHSDLTINFRNDSTVVLTPDGTGPGDVVSQVLAQLIWTASVPSYQAGVGGTLGTEEVLLTSITLGAPPFYETGDIDYLDSNVNGADINDGYFFVRMFDNTAKGLDDYYFQFDATGPDLDDTAGTPLPGFPYDSNATQPTGAFALNDATYGHQVVPEPAVASLIVIFGGGLLVGRRIFFKG